jgi:hypothetical protein
MAERGLPEQGAEPEIPEAPAAKPRTITRAEDIEIGFVEDDADANPRPIGWKAGSQSRAAVKPVPIPAPVTIIGGGHSPSEGSPLSVNGDGW